MKIKTEKGHTKIDPGKLVLKKRLSLLKNHIRVAGKCSTNIFLPSIKSGKAGATTRKRINLP
jgi:hypothetical protein